MEHKLVHFAVDKTISSILKYIDKEPQKNLLKILSIVEKTFKMYPAENYAKMRKNMCVLVCVYLLKYIWMTAEKIV